MPSLSGGVHEMDVDVEFGFGPFDSDRPRMIVPWIHHYGGLSCLRRTSIPRF